MPFQKCYKMYWGDSPIKVSGPMEKCIGTKDNSDVRNTNSSIVNTLYGHRNK